MIPRFLARLFVILLMIGSSRANDPLPRDPNPNPKAGRLLVLVNDKRVDVPIEARLKGMMTSEPGTNAWKPVGDPDLVDGVLSPQGQFLAAGRAASAGKNLVGVWVYDLSQESSRRRVFDQPYLSCQWANGGKELFVSAPAGGAKFATFRLSADGSSRIKLPLPDSETVLDGTSDGSWLVSLNLAMLRDRRALLLVGRPDGTERHPLIDEPNSVVRHCRFSPDGQRLVYGLSSGGAPTQAKTSVWIIDREGRTKVQVPLEIESGTMARPFWAPDGQRLAVALSRPRSQTSERIVMVDLDGKNREDLPLTPWEMSLIDWR